MRLSMPVFKQAAERLFEPALRNVEYFQRRLSVFAVLAFFHVSALLRSLEHTHPTAL